MRLKDRVAIVTGGSRGIGRAIATALAREGANITIASRDGSRAREACGALEALGVRALPVPTDVGRVSDIEAMQQQALAAFGRIDILVNNAGLGAGPPALELSEAEWDRILGVNLKGVFFCCQKVAEAMIPQKRGKIINLTSMLAEIGMRGMAHYCASKAGVKLVTQALAIDLAPHGIQVNAVGPGTVETDLNRATLAKPEERQWRLDRIPMRRIGTPEDIAGAVVFLASDDSNYITGQTIYVDGGRLA
jgi:NAD(P)-dependent dehydrogenase (short-subunit alcohol dehydrogenase family)